MLVLKYWIDQCNANERMNIKFLFDYIKLLEPEQVAKVVMLAGFEILLLPGKLLAFQRRLPTHYVSSSAEYELYRNSARLYINDTKMEFRT